MIITKIGYISFVPPKLVKGDEKHKTDMHTIYVCSSKCNNRIYKNKNINVGGIFIHNKIKKPTFVAAENVSLSTETMTIIAAFMRKLEEGIVKFDFEKGEFLGNEKK